MLCCAVIDLDLVEVKVKAGEVHKAYEVELIDYLIEL